MIGDQALRELAGEHGTPLFAYDLDEIGERARRLSSALPDRVDVAFAVKANPSLAVLGSLARAGLGADVASGGELAAVRRAGFACGSVTFTGPGKRDDELAMAVDAGLRAITVESPGELERVLLAARRSGRRPRILLRATGASRTDNVIGSGNGRFGMRWPDLVASARRAVAAPELELIGIHHFDASNVLDADELVAHARVGVGLAARLAEEVDVGLTVVDVGGGLGIPYAAKQPALDLGRLAAGLGSVIVEMDRHRRLAGARLLLEPGRWLVAPAGVYVVRVIDVKQAEAAKVATVDGGVHHLLRPVLVGRPHRIRSLAPDAAARPLVLTAVGGPLCTALDLLGEVRLPEARVGDLLAVLDAGAYGFTESMPYFLSHPVPPEIAVLDGCAFVARPRADPDGLLARQRLAPALTSGPPGT